MSTTYWVVILIDAYYIYVLILLLPVILNMM